MKKQLLTALIIMERVLLLSGIAGITAKMFPYATACFAGCVACLLVRKDHA